MQRTIRAAVAAAVLIACAAAPGQAFVDLAVHFEAARDNCVDGTANKDFTLRLRNSSNDLVDETAVDVPDDGGDWVACLSREVRPGDHLRAASTSQTAKFDIPAFSLHIDRVGDVLKGSLPHNKQLRLRIRDCDGFGDVCPVGITRTVTGDSHGHYEKDFTSSFDVRGLDQVEARYTDSAGNHYTLRQDVPVFVVTEGEHELVGTLERGHTSVLKIRSKAGGSVLNSQVATPDGFGHFSVTFSKAMIAPRQVTGDFATDAKLTIPDMTVTFTSSGGHDFLKTRCLPGRPTSVQWDDKFAVVVASSTGRVVIDLTDAGSPASVAVHDIRCASKAGDLLIWRG